MTDKLRCPACSGVPTVDFPTNMGVVKMGCSTCNIWTREIPLGMVSRVLLEREWVFTGKAHREILALASELRGAAKDLAGPEEMYEPEPQQKIPREPCPYCCGTNVYERIPSTIGKQARLTCYCGEFQVAISFTTDKPVGDMRRELTDQWNAKARVAAVRIASNTRIKATDAQIAATEAMVKANVASVEAATAHARASVDIGHSGTETGRAYAVGLAATPEARAHEDRVTAGFKAAIDAAMIRVASEETRSFRETIFQLLLDAEKLANISETDKTETLAAKGVKRWPDLAAAAKVYYEGETELKEVVAALLAILMRASADSLNTLKPAPGSAGEEILRLVAVAHEKCLKGKGIMEGGNMRDVLFSLIQMLPETGKMGTDTLNGDKLEVAQINMLALMFQFITIGHNFRKTTAEVREFHRKTVEKG